MNQIKPSEVLKQVAEAVPESCRENIVIIGSLAAGYAFFGDKQDMAVRTKDIDCLLKPFQLAVERGQAIARELYDAGWEPKKGGSFDEPGDSSTGDRDLPAVRLYPPGMDQNAEDAWFIELLTEPESPEIKERSFTRIVIDEGHFGLPSFRFLAVTAYLPEKIDALGIYYARPPMMALANLLEHQEIKPDRMSSPIAGRAIKRSNKDLGRVLALAYLAQEQGMDDFRIWGLDWFSALEQRFPNEYQQLALHTRAGLEALIQSDEDFEELTIPAPTAYLPRSRLTWKTFEKSQPAS